MEDSWQSLESREQGGSQAARQQAAGRQQAGRQQAGSRQAAKRTDSTGARQATEDSHATKTENFRHLLKMRFCRVFNLAYPVCERMDFLIKCVLDISFVFILNAFFYFFFSFLFYLQT